MIVLIDDSEIDIFINRKLLEVGGLNFPIESFLNPNDGLDFVLNNPKVKVVLIDNVMPGSSGFRIAEGIRKGGRHDVKLSILTASIDPRDVAKFDELDPTIQLWEKPLEVRLLKNFLSAQI